MQFAEAEIWPALIFDINRSNRPSAATNRDVDSATDGEDKVSSFGVVIRKVKLTFSDQKLAIRPCKPDGIGVAGSDEKRRFMRADLLAEAEDTRLEFGTYAIGKSVVAINPIAAKLPLAVVRLKVDVATTYVDATAAGTYAGWQSLAKRGACGQER